MKDSQPLEIRNYVKFCPNYAPWPFVDILEPGDSNWGFFDRIPEALKHRIHEWNNRFLERYDETSGLFPTQEERAAFDREYIELYNELKKAGINTELNLWW